MQIGMIRNPLLNLKHLQIHLRFTNKIYCILARFLRAPLCKGITPSLCPVPFFIFGFPLKFSTAHAPQTGKTFSRHAAGALPHLRRLFLPCCETRLSSHPFTADSHSWRCRRVSWGPIGHRGYLQQLSIIALNYSCPPVPYAHTVPSLH